MDNLSKKNKRILLLIVITIIIVSVAAIFSLIITREVEIKIAPLSATTTIDGKVYQNGKHRLFIGTHHVKIEKSGFETKEFDFDPASSSKLYAFILENGGAYDWYLTHSEDSTLLTQIGSYNNTIEAQEYTSKNQIINSLPIIYANYDKDYNYTEYRIDGGSFDGCDTDFCLKITDTTGGNLDAAKQKIKDAGFNPDSYQILYEYKPIQNL